VSFRHPKERYSRRDFLRAGAVAAAGIPAASALLAACNPATSTDGSSSTSRLTISTKTSPTPLPTWDDNQPIADGLPIEAGATLKVYNWDQYIYKKVVDDFAKKFNVNVEISTFNNMDEALSKIRSSQVDFDVFFPTIDVLGKMTEFKLLQPLNKTYLPNLSNIWPFYTDADKPFYDVGGVYTVPYTVFTTGVAWRNDLVDEKDDPWHIDNPYDLLWNPTYKGKIMVYDDYREATAMSLLKNGIMDVNTGSVDDLNTAKEALMELIPKVNVALTINGAYEDLPKGIFSATQAWSGDITASPWYGRGSYAETAPLMSYWWPKDASGVIGNDLIAVLKTAKNPVLAHTFINYMMDFEISMWNMSWNGYQPPQNQAPPEAFADPNYKWPGKDWSGNCPPNLANTISTFDDIENGLPIWELQPDVDAIWHDNWEQFTSGV
jgi:spermidine/putrescine transport system substrate-binding protein